MIHFRAQSFTSCIIAFACIAAIFAATTVEAATLRLRVHHNGRYLVQHDGTPFFWTGDTNWRLYKLNRNQIKNYFFNRSMKGFNVIQGPVLLHPQANSETSTPAGHSNTDPANPNLPYFWHIDYIVRTAQEHDLYLAMVAVWGEHWWLFDSPQTAREYGRWLGDRYKQRNNIIWIVAGEYLIDGNDAHIMNIWNALGEGLKEGSLNRHLVTIHGSYLPGTQSSSIVFHNASWLDFNMIQSSQSADTGSGSDNWNLVQTDRARWPKKPTLDGEAHYENLWHWDEFGVRRRAYWSVFAGGFGHTYGANGLWQGLQAGEGSETPPADVWNVAMTYPGSTHMGHLRRLMESRPMLMRAPNQPVLLSQSGSIPNRVQATRDHFGRYFMVYVPDQNKTVSVDMNAIYHHTARAWWYNPRNGNAMLIGVFPASGARLFTTPNWGPDWVLVVDSTAENFDRPGVGGPLR